ncbi:MULTISPECIES: glycosyltransferase family 2 protein [unclassified Bacillus (in: firmicutes)]|uniref:glycosyltransferase family 2 protein n=1 Tax=unclassified Bacillus (in: firmicutes) TaxID=185979 RepID=UPI001BE76AE7|nr:MULTISPECIES: glycosyltransferase family 2 protein [unclassified Bacillus (in: firmicutes)]MBT2638234.1 glycosyltransferase family 2 protein [Bacillus sp. ISL-39]MBT2662642.1 glycosyltransferase family 2 protein [Bacillus sp. ISL-45]
MKPPIFTIIVPCYNEEDVLEETIDQLAAKLSELIKQNMVSEKSKVLFVDDGSEDRTWHLIYKASLDNEMIKGLKLSRNAGHQNALLAGLFSAKEASDCMVTIDADLQDDIHAINEMVRKFSEGYEVVYGVRSSRESDTFFKRFTAEGFYKLMDKLGVKLVFNHADFRLMSKRAVEELEHFSESNMFLRGIVPLIGFNSTIVYYERKERHAGETKYPLKKMLGFAFDGITSFSVTPIRFVMIVGCLSFFVSLVFGLYFLTLKLFGNTELGWTSLITSIWLIGGLQLIAIGLVGEYIGKIYKETKRRPKYIIDVDLYNLPVSRKLINMEGADYEPISETRKLSENN